MAAAAAAAAAVNLNSQSEELEHQLAAAAESSSVLRLEVALVLESGTSCQKDWMVQTSVTVTCARKGLQLVVEKAWSDIGMVRAIPVA